MSWFKLAIKEDTTTHELFRSSDDYDIDWMGLSVYTGTSENKIPSKNIILKEWNSIK